MSRDKTFVHQVFLFESQKHLMSNEWGDNITLSKDYNAQAIRQYIGGILGYQHLSGKKSCLSLHQHVCFLVYLLIHFINLHLSWSLYYTIIPNFFYLSLQKNSNITCFLCSAIILVTLFYRSSPRCFFNGDYTRG